MADAVVDDKFIVCICSADAMPVVRNNIYAVASIRMYPIRPDRSAMIPPTRDFQCMLPPVII